MQPPPRLQELRERQILSKGELAKRAGTRPETITRLESGEGSAWPRTIRKLAEALGVGYEELYEEHTAQKARAPRERPVERSVGTVGVFEEKRLRSAQTREAVIDWEGMLEDVATRYREAENELGEAEEGVVPNEVIDVAVDAGRLLRLLSREPDEIRAATGVATAIEEIRAVSARVELMIEQRFGPTDEDHSDLHGVIDGVKEAAAALAS